MMGITKMLGNIFPFWVQTLFFWYLFMSPLQPIGKWSFQEVVILILPFCQGHKRKNWKVRKFVLRADPAFLHYYDPTKVREQEVTLPRNPFGDINIIMKIQLCCKCFYHSRFLYSFPGELDLSGLNLGGCPCRITLQGCPCIFCLVFFPVRFLFLSRVAAVFLGLVFCCTLTVWDHGPAGFLSGLWSFWAEIPPLEDHTGTRIFHILIPALNRDFLMPKYL